MGNGGCGPVAGPATEARGALGRIVFEWEGESEGKLVGVVWCFRSWRIFARSPGTTPGAHDIGYSSGMGRPGKIAHLGSSSRVRRAIDPRASIAYYENKKQHYTFKPGL